MSPDELRVLSENIKKRGLVNPIVVWSPDRQSNEQYLLDGRNRLDAMEMAGISTVDHRSRISVRQWHLYGIRLRPDGGVK
jgi:ParB-like chromosome segregation protein Spo0J